MGCSVKGFVYLALGGLLQKYFEKRPWVRKYQVPNTKTCNSRFFVRLQRAASMESPRT